MVQVNKPALAHEDEVAKREVAKRREDDIFEGIVLL
jgi:hypothetical protein